MVVVAIVIAIIIAAVIVVVVGCGCGIGCGCSGSGFGGGGGATTGCHIDMAVYQIRLPPPTTAPWPPAVHPQWTDHKIQSRRRG